MEDFTYDWQLHDKVNRLEVAREAALARRGVRWAKPAEGTDPQQVRALRNELVKDAANTSIIDNPGQADQLSNPNRKT